MKEYSRLKVAVAVHKPYDMPGDSAYLPVHAGAAAGAALGYQSDAQGEHISQKNGLYCELTVLYWAWKNLPCGALGLMHYRRYLGAPSRMRPWVSVRNRIASGEELESYLLKRPVLLPKKRNYFIENRRDQYIHAHGAAGYEALRRVIKRSAPDYLTAFDRTMDRTSGHCFNIFVMRRDLCDAYCSWLFSLLFEVEEEMRATAAQEITPRLFGFLSERMLDCWLETNGVAYRELPVVYLEGQNWPKKALAFLMRKFGAGKKD